MTENIQELIKTEFELAEQRILEKLGETTVSPKKTKKKRDPNAPKKPKTSYLVFCGLMRPKLRETNPEMKFAELSKTLGDMWKGLSDEEKGSYKDTPVSTQVETTE